MRLPGSNACPGYWKRVPHVLVIPSNFEKKIVLLSSFHYIYSSGFEVLIAFQYLMALMMPIPHVVRRRINCSGATAATTARQVVDDREFEQSRENECSASSHPNINCFYVRDLRGFSVQT